MLRNRYNDQTNIEMSSINNLVQTTEQVLIEGNTFQILVIVQGQ